MSHTKSPVLLRKISKATFLYYIQKANLNYVHDPASTRKYLFFSQREPGVFMVQEVIGTSGVPRASEVITGFLMKVV